MPIITLQHVQQAVTSPNATSEHGAKVDNTFYYLKIAGARISLKHIKHGDVAYIRGGVTNNVALVETINTNVDQQGKGLGKLVAAAFYEYWAGQNAASVRLGTTDTSGGFWARMGVAQGAATPMATARLNLWGANNQFNVQH